MRKPTRLDIVKIISTTNIFSGKVGVIVTIRKKSSWPYCVCFGEDTHGNHKHGIFHSKEMEFVRGTK